MSNSPSALDQIIRYLSFEGRASRLEYWPWYIMIVLVQGILSIESVDDYVWVVFIVYLLLLPPTIAVTVRRLHDLDNSGWWALLMLIPIGGFILFFWNLQKGTEGPNRFGEDPLAPESDSEI